MKINRRYTNILLILLTILSGGTAIFIVWLSPLSHPAREQRFPFGVYENRRLVELVGETGKRTYVVEDASGRLLFSIPLRNSVIDCRFRNGRLRFRNNASGREGYIDSVGYVSFADAEPADVIASRDLAPDTVTEKPVPVPATRPKNTGFRDVDISTMIDNHPFGVEAKRVIAGHLQASDSLSRRKILSYCEHFRTAYTTKDIDFLRQVFSDNALIIVGNTVRTGKNTAAGLASQERVSYAVRSKEVYLKNLLGVFESNSRINVTFSDFHIMRHPTTEGIYGVSLRQRYSSDSYFDDGYLFLLWDFRDPSMPLIHVRTWQPSASIGMGDDVIDISDFNLD
jgi:hypothetical protein